MPNHTQGRALLAVAIAGVLLASALPAASAARAAPEPARTWQLDPTFGGDGRIFTDLSDNLSIEDAVVQPDGKIVAVGPDGSTVLRYLVDGTLDATFGGTGIVRLHESERVTSVALQEVGELLKIVIGVAVVSGGDELRVWRLNPDGTLDTADDLDPAVEFGNDGSVTPRVPDKHAAGVDDLEVQADGRVVISGRCSGRRVQYDRGFVLRLLRDGQVDEDFATGGAFVDRRGKPYFAVDVGVDGSGQPVVVAAGKKDNTPNMYVIRFRADGTPDPTFGDEGRVLWNVGPGHTAVVYDIDIGPTGDVLGGGVRGRALRARPTVIRLTADGEPDAAFGSGGLVNPESSQRLRPIEAIARGPDGSVFWSLAVDERDADPEEWRIGGLDSSGEPLPAFGPDGAVAVAMDASEYTGVNSLSVDGSGRIVAVGLSGTRDPTQYVGALARLRLQRS